MYHQHLIPRRDIMNRFFYPRLALSNIIKHRKTYIPYLLSSTIIIALFYTITALRFNKDLIAKSQDGEIMIETLKYSVYLVAIFSCIFILYTNTFLTKRRRKEIGLYNILGMEKKHIMHMLLFENIYTIIISIIGGLVFGFIFGKILFLLLLKITSFIDQNIQFPISMQAIYLTILIFTPLFLVTLLSNIWQIHFSNPITLLQGGRSGEKEPKSKWLLAIIGIGCIVSSYYLAVAYGQPLHAFKSSFYALLLAIIGTYALFISISIVILKVLKRRKRFYYQTNHFTVVSGMIYRMKQNAIGLANICVLSTCVIIMLTITSSLYFGIDDFVSLQFPYKNFYLLDSHGSQEGMDQIKQITDQYLSKNHIQIKNATQYHVYWFPAKLTNNVMTTKREYNDDPNAFKTLNIVSLEEYNQLHDRHVILQPNEILWVNQPSVLQQKKKLIYNNEPFTIKEYVASDKYAVGAEDYTIVANSQAMEHFYTSFQTVDYEHNPSYIYSFNIKQKGNMGSIVQNLTNTLMQRNQFVYIQNSNSTREEFQRAYGSFLFICVFLGIEFLIATALIIYYKQIFEGYDDKEKYQIMKKVGMSTKEIKKSIHFQVLSVFFLPILIAIIHFAFGFKVISSLLFVFRIKSIWVLLTCSMITTIIFLVFYSIVYFITSKVYYKIIK